jgi:hypothetical protein
MRLCLKQPKTGKDGGRERERERQRETERDRQTQTQTQTHTDTDTDTDTGGLLRFTYCLGMKQQGLEQEAGFT